MNKSYPKILFLIIFLFSITVLSQNYSGEYLVKKIINVNSDIDVLLIENTINKGLIVMDNDSLKVDSTFTKIELNKSYFFNLKLDSDFYKFRNSSNDYGLLLPDGSLYTIWDEEKDGSLPLIFIGDNIKGIYVRKEDKKCH